MWLTANWPFVVMAIVIIGAITYLFKIGAIGKAEIEVGAKGATAKLKLQSKERQIKEKDFDSISLNEFYADSDIGFVIHKPLSEEWTIRKLSLKEVYKEKGFAEEMIVDLLNQISANIRNPNENIHNLVIRRGTAHSVRYTEETVVDGHQLDLEILKQVLPRLEEIGYDQIYISAARKDSMKSKWSLLQFFLGELQSFRPLNPKRLHVNLENTIFLLDCSVLFEKSNMTERLVTTS